MARTANMEIIHSLLLLQLQLWPYFIHLWFSQLNNGLSRLLECCHFASVCNEGLHDSWSGWQNDWTVQVGIKPLLTKKHRLYPGTFVVVVGMFHLTRFSVPITNGRNVMTKNTKSFWSHTPHLMDQKYWARHHLIIFHSFVNKVDRFLRTPLSFHWQLLIIKRIILRLIHSLTWRRSYFA